MASTFGSLTFETVREGYTLPVEAAPAEIAEMHIPGSNINIIDVGGLRATRIQRRIKIDRGDLPDWLAARLSQATLTLVDNSYGTCLLSQLTNHDMIAIGEDRVDLFDAEWIIVS